MNITKQIIEVIGCKYNQAKQLEEIMIKEPVLDYTSFKKTGITDLKAKKLFAVTQIANFIKQPVEPKKIIGCSKDAVNIIKYDIENLPYEEFWILLLNKSNRLIKKVKISQGGVAGTITDVRIILQFAINHLASAMILFHNHPSGNLKPSQADITITKRIIDAAKLLDISVLDHIIVTSNSYFSLADENMI
jgi:DNA repair protein RadC